MRERAWFPLAVVMLVTAALLSPVFVNGFVYDDEESIADGDYIHEPQRALQLFVHPTMFVTPDQRDKVRAVDTYRPLPLLTLMWDASLSGRAPWAYHLTNLLAHLACVGLLYAVARRLLTNERNWAAWIAAGMFALAPVPAEAHVWINGRSDVFCAMFGLASILFILKAQEAPRGRRRIMLFTAAGTLFLLGLLSKEVLLAALPTFWLLSRSDQNPSLAPVRLVRPLIPLALASAVYLALRINALDGMRTHIDAAQVWTAVRNLAVLELDGLTQCLVPTKVYLRMMAYDYRGLPVWVFGGAWAVVLISGGWLISQWRARPLLLWGALWFFSTLAPAAMISTMTWPGFGRYLYVPMIGLSIVAADLIARTLASYPQLKRVLVICAACYGTLLGIRLLMVVRDYESKETLYGSAIKEAPESAMGWGWLGMSRSRTDPKAAIPLLEQALRLAPGERIYLKDLADSYYKTGRMAEAMAASELGARSFEEASVFHMIIVNVMHDRQPSVAADHLLDCVRTQPEAADCSAALEDTLTRHPRRAAYRARVSERLALPQFAGIRARVASLVQRGETMDKARPDISPAPPTP